MSDWRDSLSAHDMRRWRFRRCAKVCVAAGAIFALTSLASLSTLTPPLVTTMTVVTKPAKEGSRNAGDSKPLLRNGQGDFVRKFSRDEVVRKADPHANPVHEQVTAHRENLPELHGVRRSGRNITFGDVPKPEFLTEIVGEKKEKEPQIISQADCDQWVNNHRSHFLSLNGGLSLAASASNKTASGLPPVQFSRRSPDQTRPARDLSQRHNSRPPEISFGGARASTVIMVVSSPSHVRYRQVIRATWGWEPPGGVEVVFLLGADARWDNITAREQRLHGDVVRVAVRDTYRSLPKKVLAGLRWLHAKRPGRTFYVKADDDVYVHIPGLLGLLRGELREGEVVGALAAYSLVIRDPQHKWYVSKKDFPCPVFPPYVLGGTYAMTRRTLGRLLEAAAGWRGRVPVEDVLVTGLLAWRAGVRPVDHSGFPVYWLQPKPNATDLIASRKVVSINVSPSEILRLDGEIQAYYRQLFQRRRGKAPKS